MCPDAAAGGGISVQATITKKKVTLKKAKKVRRNCFCFSYLLLDNARYDQVIASSGLSVNALTTETMLTGQGVCFSEPIQGNEGKVATLLLTLCKRCTHFSAISAALCFLLSPHPYTWE